MVEALLTQTHRTLSSLFAVFLFLFVETVGHGHTSPGSFGFSELLLLHVVESAVWIFDVASFKRCHPLKDCSGQ